MSSVFKLKESELQKLERRFQALVTRTGQKVAKAAVRAATQPVLLDMRASAPQRKGSGALRRSIKKSVRGFRRNSIVIGLVGVQRGFSDTFQGKRIVPEYYAHLVEFGRAAVRPKNSKLLSNQNGFAARAVKAAQAKPFIRPAFRRQSRRMESIARNNLATGIDQVAKEVAVR